jgi:hypothetical protein
MRGAASRIRALQKLDIYQAAWVRANFLQTELHRGLFPRDGDLLVILCSL